MTDESQDKRPADLARRIWLAGIGAYGKAFEEGKDMMKGLGGTTSGAFEDLAERGEKIELAAKLQGAKLAGKAAKLDIDDRIRAMRDRLSGSADDARIDAIERRLESIEKKLDAVLKATASPKRATTRKTLVKKTPAKKTTTKKPAAKKG